MKIAYFVKSSRYLEKLKIIGHRHVFIMVHRLQSSIMHVIFNLCIFVRIKLMEQIDISGYIINYVLCKYVALVLYIRWVGITTFYMKCDLDQF
jgi:hypothetical protein